MSRELKVGLAPLWAAMLTLSSINVGAAPGELSDKPLFLGAGSTVPPNILFILDDSGSMGWEVLLTKEARDAHSGAADSGDLDFTPNNSEEVRELCVGYNTMAYDPTKSYTPWLGIDNAGNKFTDRTLTTAYDNPYGVYSSNGDVSSPSAIHNLSSHFYIEWNDNDGDGKYDSGECPVPSSFGSTLSTTECAAATGCTLVTGLSTEQQKNYANWYTYYRVREYVLKRAMSDIIIDTSFRVGLAPLNNNNKVGVEVKDMDNISEPVSATAQANKDALMRNLFRSFPKGGTPLRGSLVNAGKYFDTTDSPNASFFGTTPSSPILPIAEGGECQQNYSVLMTDGTWNGTVASQGNIDGDNNSKWDGEPYGDLYSNTMADVAMKYYETDIAPSHGNYVPENAVDKNPAQHMVTFGVAFGVEGSLSDEQINAIRNTPAGTAGSPDWPEPRPNEITTIDDLAHSAINSRGDYLSASNPEELITQLKRSIEAIADRQGSASSLAFNTTSFETKTLVFQASFDSGGWSGRLEAKPFTTAGVGVAEWEAGSVLRSRDLETNARDVITHNGTKGVVFDFPADYTALVADDLSQAQVNDLLVNAPHPIGAEVDAFEIEDNQTFGERIVDYLKGDEAYEGEGSGLFRSRLDKRNIHHRLGDITHSSPQFVGIPNTGYPDLLEGSGVNAYSAFIDRQSNPTPRTSMVYVGANDGMLHGFDAEDGNERFAYIPGMLFSDESLQGMHHLADQNYGHQPYVDGSPLAGDVFINGSWATYLVGGFRAGGKGVYVLDITNPAYLNADNADSIVKQEFTHNDLGYSFSRPQIGRLNNGKWAAIFGNGYNNDPNGDGSAKLFILYLDGSGYELLETQAGFIDDVSKSCQSVDSDCNGLSSPAILDNTGDAIIDRVYAGDLQGNMWVFDLSSSRSADWGIAYGASNDPKPLFTACVDEICTSGGKAVNRQPITAKPEVDAHPSRNALSTEPNLMVYFGTGQYIAATDNFNTDVQSMYGVWDAGSSFAELDRDDLQTQVISSSLTAAGDLVRTLTNHDVDYSTVASQPEMGWKIDLPVNKERVTHEAFTASGLLFFDTLIPQQGICSAGGDGFVMFVDRMTGGQPGFVVLDLNNDGIFDDTKIAGLGTTGIPDIQIFDGQLVITDSSGRVINYGVQVEPARASRRSSWTIMK